jgi:imidazolonepropionase-like amidohydrolase
LAADTIGLQGQAGCLDEGAFGDLVGVAGDPLEKLDLLARAEGVALVVKGGEVVKSR